MKTNDIKVPNKIDKKTKTATGITLAVAVLLVTIGISYAMLPGDELANEPLDATASTATLKLRYTDCNDANVNTCADISAELAPGDSVSKEFKITNIGKADAKYTIYFKELTNTFKHDELVYTLENLTSNTIEANNVPVPATSDTELSLLKYLTSPVGSTVRYRLTVTFLNTNRDQADNMDAEFSMRISIKDGSKESIPDKIAMTSNGVRTSFDDPATTDEGVFEMEDDYGTSYYYRGAVTNNYVQFAGFYWRIIRLNGDGSLRIVYDGDQAYANGASSSARFIGTRIVYNTNYNDAKYVGYMYGPVGTTASTSATQAQTNTIDSTIKTYIDSWYKTNIVDKGYSSAVADILFCNDRSIPGKATTLLTNDTGLGYGTNVTGYGAFGRFMTGNNSTIDNIAKTGMQPTFKCTQKNDAFTVSDTIKGNGALTYPIGLITADEIVAAGSGKYAMENTSYYLYRPSSWWWSLSAYNFNGSYAAMFIIHQNGDLSRATVANAQGAAVAPVINLSAEYVSTMIGNGTMDNPYRA